MSALLRPSGHLNIMVMMSAYIIYIENWMPSNFLYLCLPSHSKIKNEELVQRIAELKNVNIDTIDSSPLKTQKKEEEVRGVRKEREGNDRIDIYKNGDLEKKVLEKVIKKEGNDGYWYLYLILAPRTIRFEFCPACRETCMPR
jgi:hypothetical protein